MEPLTCRKRGWFVLYYVLSVAVLSLQFTEMYPKLCDDSIKFQLCHLMSTSYVFTVRTYKRLIYMSIQCICTAVDCGLQRLHLTGTDRGLTTCSYM